MATIVILIYSGGHRCRTFNLTEERPAPGTGLMNSNEHPLSIMRTLEKEVNNV